MEQMRHSSDWEKAWLSFQILRLLMGSFGP